MFRFGEFPSPLILWIPFPGKLSNFLSIKYRNLFKIVSGRIWILTHHYTVCLSVCRLRCRPSPPSPASLLLRYCGCDIMMCPFLWSYSTPSGCDLYYYYYYHHTTLYHHTQWNIYTNFRICSQIPTARERHCLNCLETWTCQTRSNSCSRWGMTKTKFHIFIVLHSFQIVNLSSSCALHCFLAGCCIAGCTGSGRLNATLVLEPISAVVFIAFYPKLAAW
jgi:hypothetical protein